MRTTHRAVVPIHALIGRGVDVQLGPASANLVTAEMPARGVRENLVDAEIPVSVAETDGPNLGSDEILATPPTSRVHPRRARVAPIRFKPTSKPLRAISKL